MEFKKDDSCRIQESSFKCSLIHVFFNVLDIGSRLFYRCSFYLYFVVKNIKIYSEGVDGERWKHKKMINSRINHPDFMWM